MPPYSHAVDGKEGKTEGNMESASFASNDRKQ